LRIATIIWRPGTIVEEGEWSLIHNRNKAFVEHFGAEVTIFAIFREETILQSGIPNHFRDASYPIHIVSYRRRFWGQFVGAYQAIKRAINWEANAIIFSGCFSGIFLKKAKKYNIKTIWDIHGVEQQEIIEYGLNWRGIINIFRHTIADKFMRNVDAILVVTPELAYYEKRYFPKQQAFVVPCYSNITLDRNSVLAFRKKWRDNFGIPHDAWVLVHAGGMHKWQQVESYFRDFPILARKCPCVWFLCLTGDREKARKLLNQIPLDVSSRIIITKVKKEQLSEALCSADVGLLLRNSNITNLVAFPNKIDDYLSAGLNIATTSGLPAAAKLVLDKKVSGIVLPQVSLIGIEGLGQLRGARSDKEVLDDWDKAQICRESFSFKKSLSQLVKFILQAVHTLSFVFVN
jgi:hypothetical protein